MWVDATDRKERTTSEGMFNVKWSLPVVAMAILAAAAAVPPFARAEPDRHVPDLSAGYCPGGKGGVYGSGTGHSPTGHGFCDGMHYPDGSYWHMIQLNYPGPQTMQCVINPGGGPVPQPAPKGGCNGAV